MQVIQNIELLKKLQPYIKDMETEYITNWILVEENNFTDEWIEENWYYKTLTLEEVINFLPSNIKIKWDKFNLRIDKYLKYSVSYFNEYLKYYNNIEEWKTLLEAIEKMLEYLINNNFLELWN